MRDALAKQSHSLWRACSQHAASAQSSANRKSLCVNLLILEVAEKRFLPLKTLLSVLKTRSIPSTESLKATRSMREKNIENNVGASTHPCLVPLVTSNSGDLSPPSLTYACIPSWKDLIMSTKCFGQPIFSSTNQRPSRLTVSKAFVRSIKSR